MTILCTLLAMQILCYSKVASMILGREVRP
jgi:hypothetical protein